MKRIHLFLATLFAALLVACAPAHADWKVHETEKEAHVITNQVCGLYGIAAKLLADEIILNGKGIPELQQRAADGAMYYVDNTEKYAAWTLAFTQVSDIYQSVNGKIVPKYAAKHNLSVPIAVGVLSEGNCKDSLGKTIQAPKRIYVEKIKGTVL